MCVYSKCTIVLQKYCTRSFYSKRFKQLKDFRDPPKAKCYVKYTGIYKFSVTNKFIE